ncbi:hypothetical protein M1345_02455 [Patescibacteria group bacterium]|nr:hypothetical protein [Patescibacteria group bacterium]
MDSLRAKGGDSILYHLARLQAQVETARTKLLGLANPDGTLKPLAGSAFIEFQRLEAYRNAMETTLLLPQLQRRAEEAGTNREAKVLNNTRLTNLVDSMGYPSRFQAMLKDYKSKGLPPGDVATVVRTFEKQYETFNPKTESAQTLNWIKGKDRTRRIRGETLSEEFCKDHGIGPDQAKIEEVAQAVADMVVYRVQLDRFDEYDRRGSLPQKTAVAATKAGYLAKAQKEGFGPKQWGQ